jgi:urease gamma subunit
MSTQDKVVAAAIMVMAAAAISAQRNARGIGDANPEAIAFYSAAIVYRRIASFFGRRAVEAENSYWEVINNAR